MPPISDSNWLRLLPAPLRLRLEGRHNLQKILANTGWLFGDRILRMGVGLLVGIWMARYLGPGQFGLFNYAIAFIALVGAVAALGLNGIVVRDLVKKPEITETTLGSAFLLQFFGGILAFVLAAVAITFARPDDALAKLIVIILGFSMVFKATEVVKYWFESQVQAKYVVWVENLVFLLLAAIKMGLILMRAPLMAFVWSAFAEGVLTAAGLLVVYAWRGGRVNVWRIHPQRIKTLLKDGWPLILSSLAIMVYMRIDQIMLGQMVGDEAVGIYSAAVRISEAWYILPLAIVSSALPSIIEAKGQSERLYLQKLQKLYDVMVLLALSVAIPTTFLADWLIQFLFGSAYAGAGLALKIHIWASVFVFLGVASSNWLLAENLQRLSFYRTSAGCLMNIGANYILIPRYGIAGAAVGTILSQTVSAYLIDITNHKTRIAFRMKTKSFTSIFRHAAATLKML